EFTIISLVLIAIRILHKPQFQNPVNRFGRRVNSSSSSSIPNKKFENFGNEAIRGKCRSKSPKESGLCIAGPNSTKPSEVSMALSILSSETGPQWASNSASGPWSKLQRELTFFMSDCSSRPVEHWVSLRRTSAIFSSISWHSEALAEGKFLQVICSEIRFSRWFTRSLIDIPSIACEDNCAATMDSSEFSPIEASGSKYGEPTSSSRSWLKIAKRVSH
ncbi:P2 GpU family protein, partial [Striga asiatica]